MYTDGIVVIDVAIFPSSYNPGTHKIATRLYRLFLLLPVLLIPICK